MGKEFPKTNVPIWKAHLPRKNEKPQKGWIQWSLATLITCERPKERQNNRNVYSMPAFVCFYITIFEHYPSKSNYLIHLYH